MHRTNETDNLIVQNQLEPEQERLLIVQAHHSPEAFRVLYRHYFPKVYAYVANRVERIEDAEDLTAETFVNVVKNLKRFEYQGEGAFAAWIFRIARNNIGMFYRRNHRHAQPIPLDDLPEMVSDELLPDDALVRKEPFVLLCSLINNLSPRRQEVIRLKYFAELRNIEIAVILELDERTIASHLSRGIDDLQKLYRTILDSEEKETS